MNIYLITVGTFGLLGLIKIRNRININKNKNRNENENENKIKNISYVDCWQEVHKSTKEYIFANIIYKLLYMFSLCQIRYNKMVRYFSKHHKKIENKRILYLDSNGLISPEDSEYSGLFLSDSPNMAFYASIPKTFEYNVLPFHFINVELEYGGKIYPVHLKTDSVNYYIANNSLNAFFVKYYIQNVLKLSIDAKNPFKYILNIIDHNVNCITLNQVQTLILTEDGYEIE